MVGLMFAFVVGTAPISGTWVAMPNLETCQAVSDDIVYASTQGVKLQTTCRTKPGQGSALGGEYRLNQVTFNGYSIETELTFNTFPNKAACEDAMMALNGVMERARNPSIQYCFQV